MVPDLSVKKRAEKNFSSSRIKSIRSQGPVFRIKDYGDIYFFMDIWMKQGRPRERYA